MYDRPANLFVAGFIGSPAMNFLLGTLCARRQAQVELADGTAADRAGWRSPAPTASR